MSSDDIPSMGVLLGSICGVIFFHYFLPVLHYYFIKAYSKTNYGTPQRMNAAATNEGNQYIISKEEAKEILKSETSTSRVLSMHFTVGVYAWIAYFAVMSGMKEDDVQQGTKLVFDILGYIHLPAFILFLWVELLFSWEYDYLSAIMEEKSCKTYIQELKEQRPLLILGVEAYHYESRLRTYTYTGANGQQYMGTETYEERVQDYTETMQFPYTRWEDCSPDPDTLHLDPDKLTRVKMLKLVMAGDEETINKIASLREELEDKAENLYPSSHIEFDQDDGIPLFLDRLCAYWATDKRKWWANRTLYVILSLLLLSWFYRIAFLFATQSTCYRVVKKVYYSGENCSATESGE